MVMIHQKGELQGWFWTGIKSLKWWLQSFLVAIETVVVGHRNDHGHVKKVSSIRTDEIQKQAKWYGGACIRFISVVLSSVCENLHQDGMACLVEFGGRRVHVILYPTNFWKSFLD